MLRGYSKAVIYRHPKKPLAEELQENECIDNGMGFPSKLSLLDHRNIKKTLLMLHETKSLFTSNCVQVVTGLEHVSNRTVRRTMDKAVYKYQRSRKKEILTKSDIQNILAYCKNYVEQDFIGVTVSAYILVALALF